MMGGFAFSCGVGGRGLEEREIEAWSFLRQRNCVHSTCNDGC